MKKTCKRCGADALIKDNFCMECGGSEFKIIYNQTNVNVLKDNEKQCPNCSSIINKYIKTCPFCNYDLKLENISIDIIQSVSSQPKVEFSPKEEIIVKKEHYQLNQDAENSNKNLYIIFGVILLLIVGIWYYSHNKNNDSDEQVVVDETTPVQVDSTKDDNESILPTNVNNIEIETIKNINSESESDSVETPQENSTVTYVIPNETNEMPKKMRFTVKVEKSYLYFTPTGHILKAYLIAGDKGTYLAEKDGFVYTRFTNSNGVQTEGWLLISDLEIQ